MFIEEVRERVLALNGSKFTTKCVVSPKIRDLKKRLITWVWGSEREALWKGEIRTECKWLNGSVPDKEEMGRGNKGIKY